MKNQIMTMEMVNDGQHITSLEIAKLVGKASGVLGRVPLSVQ